MNDELSQGPEAGTGATGRFLHIAGGKIIERTTQDNPKAIRRTPKPNDDGTPRPDVYELHYEAFSGIIEGMHNRERSVPWQEEPIKSTVLHLRAGGEIYNLELEHNSRYWPIFVSRLASGKIDFSRGVRIKAWDYERKIDGKRMIGLGVYQKATEAQKAEAAKPDSTLKIEEDGTVMVPPRWTKDNPGKLPPAVQIPIPGKKPVWSFEERDNFLRSVVEHFSKTLKDKHEANMSTAEAIAAPQVQQQPSPVYQPAMDDGISEPKPSQQMPSPDLTTRVQAASARQEPVGVSPLGEDDLPF